MRQVWTTSAGADPRLRRVFRGVRAGAVVCAVVDGAPVFVTATDEHYDGDCPWAAVHDCYAKAVQVWDAATGELVRTVSGVGGDLLVATVLGGRPVAVVCDWSDTPKLIDLEAGVVQRGLAGHRNIVRDLALAALEDGPAVVSVGLDESIRVVRLGTGGVREFQAGERLRAVSVAVVGGRVLAVVAGAVTVGLWDLELGVRVGSLPTAAKVRKIATWPDGDSRVALLTSTGDVEVWDAASGERLSCRMTGDSPLSRGIVGVVADDGRHLAVRSDPEAVHVWDVDADGPVGPPLVGPTGYCGVTGGGQGVVVTVSDLDAAIGVWRVGSDVPHRGAGHTSTITCVAVGPDDRVVAGGTDGTVGSWRLEDGTREPAVGALAAPVRAVAAVPVGTGVVVLAGGGNMNHVKDDALHRWFDGGPDQPIAAGHGGEVRIAVATVVDGRPVVLTAGNAPTRVIDVTTGDRLIEFPGRPDGIAVGVLDGRPVAAVSRLFNAFQLWDIAAGSPVATSVTDAVEVVERVHALVQVDEEPAIVTVRNELVRIRCLKTGETWSLDPDNALMVTSLAAHGGELPMAAVARVDGSVSVFDLRAKAVVDTVTVPYSATALAWTPGGDLIAACRRDLLRWTGRALGGGPAHR